MLFSLPFHGEHFVSHVEKFTNPLALHIYENLESLKCLDDIGQISNHGDTNQMPKKLFMIILIMYLDDTNIMQKIVEEPRTSSHAIRLNRKNCWCYYEAFGGADNNNL
jgi:hypothetical protein